MAGYISEEGKLLPVFASSNINIYPYQIAAALFAMRSPYLKGVILADEGSLGKTYEALLISAQRWYEGRDKQLIVLPTNLVQQWVKKIEEGFTLPYVLIDTDERLREYSDNPFDQSAIVITTYDFAVAKSELIESIKWDLVIFDEASIFAKSYTGDNKTSSTLKQATEGTFRVLLTPTPITMSIMDVYGLLWFIDETILPDEKEFYNRYFRKPENYHELTSWVSNYCFRTLKSQVSEYVNFSFRVPYTISYDLSKEELELYTKLNNYLDRETKLAYPKMEKYDLTLMYHHTLSSSTEALCRTLEGAIGRIPDGEERDNLKEIVLCCEKLVVGSKMRKLAEVLKAVFQRLKANKYQQKAIIFTDNKITQSRLHKLLIESGYGAITYSGNNSRDYSIMEQFRCDDSVQILIATDDAAKGIDIEFCPVVVNYDLLYNAVELEQRITRCHRQGQKSDTLVVNLLCKENFADVRIMELINKRVLQFGGIFGLSDNILGNFNVSINEVLFQLRPAKDIEMEFARNLAQHKSENRALVESTEQSIFRTFTSEVARKVTITPDYIEDKIKSINDTLWEVARWYFENIEGYSIDNVSKTITAPNGELQNLFYYWNGSRNRPYRSQRQYGMSQSFKPNAGRITLTSILGRNVLNEVACVDEGKIIVDAEIEPCTIGLYGITIKSKSELERQTYYTYIGRTQSGETLSDAECRAIMDLPVKEYEEKSHNHNQPNYNSRIFVGSYSQPNPLDTLIDRDSYITKQLTESERISAEHISVMRRKTAIAKTAMERETENLKVEIKRAEKSVAAATDRLSKIKADKGLKVLKRDLQQREDNLFMEGMRLDVALEEQIKAFTSEQRFSAEVLRHFIIEII
ncbi:MAG: DEAD/DEAH box helicase [Rikenellaceae bacterium]